MTTRVGAGASMTETEPTRLVRSSAATDAGARRRAAAGIPAAGWRPSSRICTGTSRYDTRAPRRSHHPDRRELRRANLHGLVRPRPNLLVQFLELVRGEVAPLTDADDLALVRLHLRHRIRDLPRDLLGDAD